jgi:hypothetical protein
VTPLWAPSEATTFRCYVVAAVSGPEATPSASGNDAAVRVSSLHGVRRKPVCPGLLPHCRGEVTEGVIECGTAARCA